MFRLGKHGIGVVVLALGLSGCLSSISAYPERATDPDAELKALKKYLESSAITKYDAAADSERDGLTKRQWRDAVVNARIRAIDLHFNAFQQDLFQEGVGIGIGTDWAVLALNATGSLVGSAAPALSATSAGLIGAKSSFDKNAYFDKTMPTLMSAMIAKRKVALVKLRQGLNKDIAKYPLMAALADLEDYFDAGTIPGSLTEIAQKSSETASEADAELKKTLIVSAVPAPVQARRETLASRIKALSSTQRDDVAQALGEPSGANALRALLRAVASAETTEAVARIEQTLQILAP